VQGCAFCSKSDNFSYPLISRPLKGHNLEKNGLREFLLDLLVTPSYTWSHSTHYLTLFVHAFAQIAYSKLQESIANAKVSAQQQCMYKGRYWRNLRQIVCSHAAPPQFGTVFFHLYALLTVSLVLGLSSRLTCW